MKELFAYWVNSMFWFCRILFRLSISVYIITKMFHVSKSCYCSVTGAGYNYLTLKRNMPRSKTRNGLMCKIDKNPRITRVGKFIRKTSIDEPPQPIAWWAPGLPRQA